jgi:protein O-mannosyl-transferase
MNQPGATWTSRSANWPERRKTAGAGKMPIKNLTVPLLLITFFLLVSYLPSLNNGFTNWDDSTYISNNLDVRNLSWLNAGHMFTGFYFSNYQPLTLLSYALEYRMFKAKPFIYHLDSLLLHLFNCFLVLWLILLISENIFVSTVTALLFAVHPLHVESVAWISGRKDVLYTFFFLLSLISYCYWLRSSGTVAAGRKFYRLSLFAFVLSALSKSLAVTLPVVLFLLDYLHERRFGMKLLTEKIPFLAIAFAAGIASVVAQLSTDALSAKLTLMVFRNILIASHSTLFYLMKTFIPIKLSCLYPTPGDKLGPEYFLSLLIIILISALLILKFSRSRKIVLASLFFAVNLLPALQFIPVGLTAVADRYTYVPLIGVFFLIGETADRLISNKYLKFTAAAAIISLLSFLSLNRALVWKDSMTLWNNVIRNYPEVSTAFANRGVVFSQQGKYGEAIADFRKALKLNPKLLDTYNHLGIVYAESGDIPKAVSLFNHVLKVKPRLAPTLYNLGKIYARTGQPEKAVSYYTRALNSYPRYVDAANNRGNIYLEEKDYEKALGDFSYVIRLAPDYPAAYFNRGNAYFYMKRWDNAIADYSRAIKLKPDYEKAYLNRINAYVMLRDYAKARKDEETLKRMKP